MNGRYAFVVSRLDVFDPLLDVFLVDLVRESTVCQQRVHYLVKLATTGDDSPAIVQNIQNKGIQLEGFASSADLSAIERDRGSQRNSHFLPRFFTTQENESTAQVACRPLPSFTNDFMLVEGYPGLLCGCFRKG